MTILACGCSTFGSVREDCEQMTGRCVCKAGIQGQKCTICTSHDKVLGPNGCVPGMSHFHCFCFVITFFHSRFYFGKLIWRPLLLRRAKNWPAISERRASKGEDMPSASATTNAKMKLTPKYARWIKFKNPELCNMFQVVCGSDGQTYTSACQLRKVACRHQKDIVVQAFGTCKGLLYNKN